MATTRNIGTIVVQFVRDSKRREYIRTEARLPDGSTMVVKDRITAQDRDNISGTVRMAIAQRAEMIAVSWAASWKATENLRELGEERR